MDLYPSASPSNLVDLESKWQPLQKQKKKNKKQKQKKKQEKLITNTKEFSTSC